MRPGDDGEQGEEHMLKLPWVDRDELPVPLEQARRLRDAVEGYDVVDRSTMGREFRLLHATQ